MYIYLLKRNRVLRSENLSLKKNKAKASDYNDSVKRVFNKDQLYSLKSKNFRGYKWSKETITKAMQLQFTCGTAGYRAILSQNLPFPSARTLRYRLQNFKFKEGVLDEVFEFLKIKVDNFDDFQKECTLDIDEMSIAPGICYDRSNDTRIGSSSLTNKDDRIPATHLFVFLLCGIGYRFKQVVAYYFTGDSTSADLYKETIVKVIKKAEDIGLRVNSITTDMGSNNTAMWNKFGIKCGRYVEAKSCTVHPYDKKRKLFFLPDMVHVFKNICMGLVKHKLLYFDKEIQKKYDLPTNYVSMDHVQKFFKGEEDHTLKLNHKLQAYSFLPKNACCNFDESV